MKLIQLIEEAEQQKYFTDAVTGEKFDEPAWLTDLSSGSVKQRIKSIVALKPRPVIIIADSVRVLNDIRSAIASHLPNWTIEEPYSGTVITRPVTDDTATSQ